MKLQLTILLFLIIALSSCIKKEDSKTTQSVNTESKSTKLNGKTSLWFEYKQPIHNYKVQILWIPDSIPAENPMGCAIIYFENQNGVKFSVLDSNYVCTDIQPKVLKGITPAFATGAVFYLKYPDKKSKQFLRNDVPFFFQDVNFDSTDELIINEKGLGQRGWDRYRVYLLDKNGRLLPASQQITYQQPFVDFDTETRFDIHKRSVTTYAVGGASDFNHRTYQISNKSTTSIYNKYVLTLIDEWVAGVHKVRVIE